MEVRLGLTFAQAVELVYSGRRSAKRIGTNFALSTEKAANLGFSAEQCAIVETRAIKLEKDIEKLFAELAAERPFQQTKFIPKV